MDTSWHPKGSSIAIVANGEIDLELLETLKEFSTLVAVDGGLKALDALKIVPDLITGDFDSASPSLLEAYASTPKLETPDQSKTDLQKALEFIFTFALDKVVVFGALGKRIDHTLMNIHLLALYKEKLIYETTEETLLSLPRIFRLMTEPGQALSLIPFYGKVTGISTQGLKWELHKATLNKNFLGISNVSLKENIEIAYEEGDLLLCLNKHASTN